MRSLVCRSRDVDWKSRTDRNIEFFFSYFILFDAKPNTLPALSCQNAKFVSRFRYTAIRELFSSKYSNSSTIVSPEIVVCCTGFTIHEIARCNPELLKRFCFRAFGRKVYCCNASNYRWLDAITQYYSENTSVQNVSGTAGAAFQGCPVRFKGSTCSCESVRLLPRRCLPLTALSTLYRTLSSLDRAKDAFNDTQRTTARAS